MLTLDEARVDALLKRIVELEAKLATIGEVTLCDRCNGTGKVPSEPNNNRGACCPIGHSRDCACRLCTWMASWYDLEKKLAQRDAAIRDALDIDRENAFYYLKQFARSNGIVEGK